MLCIHYAKLLTSKLQLIKDGIISYRNRLVE